MSLECGILPLNLQVTIVAINVGGDAIYHEDNNVSSPAHCTLLSGPPKHSVMTPIRKSLGHGPVRQHLDQLSAVFFELTR